MNAWISDQLSKIDMRAEKYCEEFDNIKKSDPIHYNIIKNFHQNLLCSYSYNCNCKCQVKCKLPNINDVLDQCEQVLSNYYEIESEETYDTFEEDFDY